MINEGIRDKEIRVVGDGGEQLGIMSSKDALELASKKGMDLVKIAPQAEPPVCRIMDYGKYKFDLAKKEKEIRKNQKIVSIKEVQLSATIDEHDFMTKLNNAKKFLSQGDKVKVSLKFRGREMAHTDIGKKLLERFAEEVSELGTVEKNPTLEGRNFLMFLSPKN